MATGKIYNQVLREGIPDSWSDTVALQKQTDNKVKGWNYEVEWKQSTQCDSIGVFAAEDISKGSVLRRGVKGENFMTFTSAGFVSKILSTSF